MNVLPKNKVLDARMRWFVTVAALNYETRGDVILKICCNIEIHRSNTDATFTTLGLRASTDLGLDEIKATARGMLGWRHAFGDVAPTSTFAFAGGDGAISVLP